MLMLNVRPPAIKSKAAGCVVSLKSTPSVPYNVVSGFITAMLANSCSAIPGANFCLPTEISRMSSLPLLLKVSSTEVIRGE